MTNMHRVSLAIPDELEARIFALRKNEEFARCTYSELIRRLLEHGLAIVAAENNAHAST